MASTRTSIINKALAHLGERPITSLTEGTAASDIADAVFDELAREAMYEHPWTFIRRRAVLAPTGTTPPFEWSHEFELPERFLRFIKTYPEFPNTYPYAVEGGYMYTNTDAPQMEYIVEETDISKYPPGFVACLALLIAVHIAPRVKDSERSTNELYAMYKDRLVTMRSLDSQQGTPDPVQQDEWLDERY